MGENNRSHKDITKREIREVRSKNHGQKDRYRNRPGHDLLLRGRVPAWQGRDHRQRPGQQDHAQLRGLYRHREAHRGRGKNQVAMNPTNTIFDAKRLIGRKFHDTAVQADMKHWPFKVTNSDGKPRLSVEYKTEERSFTPEEVSAMVLTKMKETAEAYLGSEVKDAVVT